MLHPRPPNAETSRDKCWQPPTFQLQLLTCCEVVQDDVAAGSHQGCLQPRRLEALLWWTSRLGARRIFAGVQVATACRGCAAVKKTSKGGASLRSDGYRRGHPTSRERPAENWAGRPTSSTALYQLGRNNNNLPCCCKVQTIDRTNQNIIKPATQDMRYASSTFRHKEASCKCQPSTLFLYRSSSSLQPMCDKPTTEPNTTSSTEMLKIKEFLEAK